MRSEYRERLLSLSIDRNVGGRVLAFQLASHFVSREEHLFNVAVDSFAICHASVVTDHGSSTATDHDFLAASTCPAPTLQVSTWSFS